MEFSVEELFDNLNFEEYDYFYHITGSGIGEHICNDGLLMVEKRLGSTTIEITPAMINDVQSFILNERCNSIRKTDEMVIISCPKDERNFLVQKNNYINGEWVNDNFPEYIIPSEYIMGYIDMRNNDDEFIFYQNSNYYLDDSYGYGK